MGSFYGSKQCNDNSNEGNYHHYLLSQVSFPLVLILNLMVHPTTQAASFSDCKTSIFKGCIVQNGSGAHPASYPMDTGDSFPADKAAGA